LEITRPGTKLRVVDVPRLIRRHVLAWLGLWVVLWPFPPGGPAPLPFNFHRVSFCIGPALYKYGHGLLPGVDLFSQYGAGQGFFFAFFLGDTARETVDNFYVLYLSVTLAFFLLAYHFLAILLNSRGWAFSVCLLALLCQFHDWEGPKFTVTPSIGVYRMPFLILVGWLFARLGVNRFGPGAALPLGCALGLSLFWSTDTGLASLCACLCSAFVLSRSIGSAAGTAVALIASTSATFLALSVTAYGTGALSLRYLKGLVAPWTWYTGGALSLHRYPWEYDNGYFFTLIALTCAISVIVSLSTRLRTSRHRIPFAVGGLVFLGFVSLFLHAKYAVEPIYGYWAGTALPALAVMAWAIKDFSPDLYRRLIAWECPGHFHSLQARRAPRVLAALTGFLCWAWLAVGVRSPENLYGLRSYRGYNSLLNTAIRSALTHAGIRDASPSQARYHSEADGIAFFAGRGDAAAYCTGADIELVRRNTERGERTAIVSWYDWALLLEAKRPPRYFILPVPSSVQLSFVLEEVARVTKESRVLFVDKRSEDLLTKVDPHWRNSFDKAQESDNLWLYLPRRADVERPH
jgi:hypothetical protein